MVTIWLFIVTQYDHCKNTMSNDVHPDQLDLLGFITPLEVYQCISLIPCNFWIREMILPQIETWHQPDPVLPIPLCVPLFVSSDSGGGSQGVSVFLYLCLCICICWRRESLPAVLSFDPGSHGVSGRSALHSVTSELSFRDPSLLLALHINWEHQDPRPPACEL